ncbi:hypothetical protein [Thioalkalivibrio thiocyanodenitrificans]|uniref:hypothetical protein n=1 Tax=Thioalkalivibrio thiocyanodenitrificans TaxID=243063 RepID=UPI000362D8AF|nr:hypothetical protein [Thioalkalivibrio thiocyanodenitrificans]
MTSTKHSDENEPVAQVLEGLMAAAQAQSEASYQAVSGLPALQRAHAAAKNLDATRLWAEVVFPFEKLLDGLIASAGIRGTAAFALKRYRFVICHLKEIFTRAEGHMFCADKAETVLYKALSFYVKGERITWNPEGKTTYNIPKRVLIEHDDIIAFLDALYALEYGSPDKYLQALGAISKQGAAPGK